MKKVESQIDALTRAVERLISNPVAPVAPVAPIAPVLPLAPLYTGDHDLLTKIDTKVENLTKAVDALSNRDDSYVLKDDFNFWRNILVAGLLLTIAVGIISNLIHP